MLQYVLGLILIHGNFGNDAVQMAEQSLKDRTAKGLFWGGVSSGGQQLLGLLFGIVLARILNAEDYGMIGMLAIFTGVFGSILDSGFTIALTNKKDIEHKDYNAVFWFSCLSGLLIYIFLFFLAPLIARFFSNPELTPLSRFLFLGILLNGLGVSHNAFLFKNLKVKERAKIDLASLIISGITGIVLALQGFAYWGLAVQSVVYIGVGVLLRWFYAPWRPTWSFSVSPLFQMFNFSSKILLANIFNHININIFSVFLGRYYTETQVGYYTQGYKWAGQGMIFIATMMNNVAQPVFSIVNEDIPRQKAILRKMIRFGAFLSFPLMLGLGFVGKEFIYITIGEKWFASIPFLQAFCVWGAVYFLYTLFTGFLMSHGKSTIYMLGIVSTGIMQLLALYLLSDYGIMIMIYACILINYIMLLCWGWVINSIIKISLFEVVKDVFPYLGATLFSIGCAYFLTKGISNNYYLLSARISLVAVIYATILWLGKSILLKETLAFLFKKRNEKS